MHPLIDTHTHLCDDSFEKDLGVVLDQAAAAGVERVISVSETVEDGRRNLALAEHYPSLLPAAGLYPTYLDVDAASGMREFIRRHQGRLVAIGEVGLDFWAVQEEGGREIQQHILEAFVDLSLELELPLNVHSRSAGRQTVELLLRRNARRVQLHAFDGKFGAAMPAVEAGFFFSIPASVARSRQKQKLVHQLPISCLLLETDSPVLGPEPGRRNEPVNVRLALQSIAEIKEVSTEGLAEAIYENTRRLYGQIF
jgi:TatD DNase family protein